MVKANPFLKIQSRELLVWVFTVLLCLGFVLAFLRKIINPDQETETIVFQVLFYLLLWWWIYRKAKQTGIGVCGFVRGGEPVKKLRLAGLVFLLLAFSMGAPLLIGYFLSYIAPSVLEWDWWYQGYYPENSLYPTFSYIFYLLLALVFAPVVEEFIFRGFLLNRWATKWGTRTSILATSAAFAILHTSIISTFVFAICMAILYLKSRSLLAPILAHFLNNAVATAWRFLPREETQSELSITEYYRSYLWQGLLWVMISLPVLLAYIYRNWPKKNDMPPHSEESDQKLSEHTVNNASYQPYMIRKESAADIPAIYQVNERAFEQPEEAKLVDVLRANGKASISLVAENDGQIVGHILFSTVTLEPANKELIALGLAPMAVLPEFQNQGIGSLLVNAGLDECRKQGCDFVAVLGHPAYYPRFGFLPSVNFNIKSEYDVPDDVFMLLELREGALSGCSGIVKYQPEFAAV